MTHMKYGCWFVEQENKWAARTEINKVSLQDQSCGCCALGFHCLLTRTHTHTHSTRPQTHWGWQRLNMLPPAQRNLHPSQLSSLQSHAGSNDPKTPPFWDMQFEEKMSLRRWTNVSEWRGEKKVRRRKERRRVRCESLAQWERRCSRTNWESLWAMGGSAAMLLASAQVGGRLWAVKLANIEPCGNPS